LIAHAGSKLIGSFLIAVTLSSIGAPYISAADGNPKVQYLEAKKLVDDGFNEDAVRKLDPILETDPQDAEARFTRAVALYNLGRNYSAQDDLKYLFDHKSANAQTWLAAGRVYQKLNKLDLAVNAYREFAKLDPKSEEAPKYETLIGILEQQLKNKASTSVNPSAAVKLYLNDATADGIMKWTQARLPIIVYITPSQEVPGYKPVYEDLMRQALDEWTSATNGKISFVLTKDPTAATLKVLWVTDLQAQALVPEAGKTFVHEDGEGVDSAEVKLLTHSPFPDEPMTNDLMHNISLHELGHALGLVGHSPNPDDIMFPKLSVQNGISPSDSATLMTLYGWGSAGANVVVPSVSIKDLAPAVQCQHLTREGSKAAMSGNFELAMQKLTEALAIDPTIKVARDNLSVAANNLAINQTDLQESIRMLHIALYWNPSSDLSRKNLNAFLSNSGEDPASFPLRVKRGDSCVAKHDSIGAIVEYTEALSIKNDPALSAKIAALKKSMTPSAKSALKSAK
jgi:tetratricopeptide (TPR) repeat protein